MIYLLHGRRAVASGDVRLQTQAGRDGRPSRCPSRSRKGQQIAQLQGATAELLRPAAQVRAVRPVGPGDLPSSSRTSARSPTRSASSARCTTEAINHDPAHTFMNTGTTITGRPSMGSWLPYGLGSETRRPAGLRRAHLDRARRPDAADRRAAVAQRLSAQPVPGRPASPQGRPGALRRQPAGRHAQSSSAT